MTLVSTPSQTEHVSRSLDRAPATSSDLGTLGRHDVSRVKDPMLWSAWIKDAGAYFDLPGAGVRADDGALAKRDICVVVPASEAGRAGLSVETSTEPFSSPGQSFGDSQPELLDYSDPSLDQPLFHELELNCQQSELDDLPGEGGMEHDGAPARRDIRVVVPASEAGGAGLSVETSTEPLSSPGLSSDDIPKDLLPADQASPASCLSMPKSDTESLIELANKILFAEDWSAEEAFLDAPLPSPEEKSPGLSSDDIPKDSLLADQASPASCLSMPKSDTESLIELANKILFAEDWSAEEAFLDAPLPSPKEKRAEAAKGLRYVPSGLEAWEGSPRSRGSLTEGASQSGAASSMSAASRSSCLGADLCLSPEQDVLEASGSDDSPGSPARTAEDAWQARERAPLSSFARQGSSPPRPITPDINLSRSSGRLDKEAGKSSSDASYAVAKERRGRPAALSPEKLRRIQSWLDKLKPADLNVPGGRLTKTWLHQAINNELGLKIQYGTLCWYFEQGQLKLPEEAKKVEARKKAALTPEELDEVQSWINTLRPANLGVQREFWDKIAVRRAIINKGIKPDIPRQMISEYIKLGLLRLPEDDVKQAAARKKAALTPEQLKEIQSWINESTPFKMGVGVKGEIWNVPNLRKAIIKKRINPDISRQVLWRYIDSDKLILSEESKEAEARKKLALTPQELDEVQSWLNESTPFIMGVGEEGEAWCQANVRLAIQDWFNPDISQPTVSKYFTNGKLHMKKREAGQPTGGSKRDLTSGLLASMEESAGPSQASVLRSQEPAPNPAKKPRL